MMRVSTDWDHWSNVFPSGVPLESDLRIKSVHRHLLKHRRFDLLASLCRFIYNLAFPFKCIPHIRQPGGIPHKMIYALLMHLVQGTHFRTCHIINVSNQKHKCCQNSVAWLRDGNADLPGSDAIVILLSVWSLVQV